MVDWKLVQVRPNADAIAARNLERQGFITFQPLEIITCVRAGRFVSRPRSFFTGYMFVSYRAAEAPWSLVDSTYGVARLVRFGDKLASVPCELVEELRVACDENGVIRTRSALVAGAKVEITYGTFTGFAGEVERLLPDHRAVVLLDFLGKQTRTSIEVAQLKIASQQSSKRGERP